jgi:type I restriction enzyme S subunit
MRLPISTPEEQAAIVRFLDYADRLILRYIRARKKLVALLNEQKQAIINQAVTRGIDSNAKLKPSGVEWLGNIPEHWKIERLKSLVTDAVAGPYGSSLTKSMYVNYGYRVYGQQQVIPDNFKIGDYYITPEKFAEMKRYRVFPQDVLVSVMGTVGRVAVVPDDAEPGIINPRLVRYRPDFRRIQARYLQLVLQGPTSRAQFAESSKGTTMEGLNMQILGKTLVLVPPWHEQQQILNVIALESEMLVSATASTEREIKLLQEYRARLIADVVTGKLDVHEAAAHLPDKAEELETADESEEFDEIDEEPDASDLEEAAA